MNKYLQFLFIIFAFASCKDARNDTTLLSVETLDSPHFIFTNKVTVDEIESHNTAEKQQILFVQNKDHLYENLLHYLYTLGYDKSPSTIDVYIGDGTARYVYDGSSELKDVYFHNSLYYQISWTDPEIKDVYIFAGNLNPAMELYTTDKFLLDNVSFKDVEQMVKI